MLTRVILCVLGGENMPIIKIGKNSWRFQCQINKKRFSKTYHFYCETKSEIEKEYYDWKIRCEKGEYYNTHYTLKEFSEIWIKDYVEPQCSPLVLKNYKTNLKNWILPELGEYKLENINTIILDNFIHKLKFTNTKYKYRENHALSNGTITKIWKITKTMMHIAYTKGLIPSNPCDKISLDLKRSNEPKLHFWNIEEYKKVLELLEEDGSLRAFVVEFALKTGLRRSEMFGLTWNDVDFHSGSISVNKTRQKVNGKMKVLPCKSLSSVREISIPESIIHKLYRLRAISKTNYIFEKMDYDEITAWYRKFVRKNNLPYIRFHDLRHTHASLLLYKGIDIKTISQRLGHSNIGTTMNVYTHVMKELDVKASNAIEAI